MKRRKPLYAALVGCGRVGFLLERDPLRPKPCTHAGGIAAHPDFELVAGCDLDADRLNDFGRTYGIAKRRLYRSAADLLKNERLDLLCVATWTESHDAIVRQAFSAGVPAVVCEKPMAVTYAQARAMVSAARRAGALLLINHSRRWLPEYRAVRLAVASGRFGALRHVQGCVLTSFGLRPPEKRVEGRAGEAPSWHAVIEKSGGGPLLHDGTHLLDIVFYVTGRRPAWVEGRIERHANAGIEHHATGRILLEGRPDQPLRGPRCGRLRRPPDVEFCFEAGGARRYFHFEVELWFESGRIVIGNGIRIAEISVPSNRYSGFQDLAEDREFSWDTNHATADQVSMEELARWFSDGVPPENRAEEAILSQAAVFATYESAVRGRRIFFPYRSSLRHPLLIRAKK